MALSLQDPVFAKRRFLRAIPVQAQSSMYQVSMTLLSWLMQFGGKPDLQVVEHDLLSSTEVVIADAACSALAWIQRKATATATYSKATDSATTSSDADSEYRIKLAGVNNVVATVWPKGAAFASGITCQGNTAPSTGTGSGADGAVGVWLLAASGYALG